MTFFANFAHGGEYPLGRSREIVGYWLETTSKTTSLLQAATLLVSAGHRPILPAGCSPFLHLTTAALPDAVGALEHCSTKAPKLADADLPQVLRISTPLWWASLWELCIFLAMAMAWASRMGLVLIIGADEGGGAPLQGPFLSQVPSFESVTAS